MAQKGLEAYFTTEVLANNLNEQKLTSLFDSAVMANEFAVTHKGLYLSHDPRTNYQCTRYRTRFYSNLI